MDATEPTYTTVQISAARRQQLERLRLKMSIERDEIVMLRDALDGALEAGIRALHDDDPLPVIPNLN